MEEYLKNVLEQIRCKKAHPYVEKELRDHLEDQIRDNISCGMEEAAAIDSAIRDMGDPIETGIMLDKVHRPQIAWKMVLLIGIISILGALIHILICRHANVDAAAYDGIVYSPISYIQYMFLGLLVMTVLYRIDYTFLARYAKVIAVLLILLCALTLWIGPPINGAMYWISIGGIFIPARSLMLLYVPVYGGILYKYYGKGYEELCFSIVWMILPVLFVFRMPALTTACILFVSMLVMVTIALIKGWFKVRKKAAIMTLWGIFGVLPIIGLALLKVFFNNSGKTYYLTSAIRECVSNLKFVGSSGTDVAEKIGGINSDYLLTYLSSSYGLLAGIAICCIFAAIVFYIFGLSNKLKNQLGMMIGFGCGMILVVSLILNLLVNIGAIPPTATSLPFLSAGGGNIVVSYALIGIVLSVYKFKNVYPRHIRIDAKKKRKADIFNG